MNPKKLIDSSSCPTIESLEAISVKIECLNAEKEVLNNGTGTLFSNRGSFYVITAAHCIQNGDSSDYFPIESIKISLPRFSKSYIEVKSVLLFMPNDEYDFALLTVNFNIESISMSIDYENGIRFIGKDEFENSTCLYGYTSTEPNGRKFRTHMVSSDTYAIDESISATGVEFSRVMKGSSGGGIFVRYKDWICCVGYVKSRMTEKDRLDDIKIRRIPSEINERLGYPLLLSSIQQNQIFGRSAVGGSDIEIEYVSKWNELFQLLSNKEDANKILDEIKILRTNYPCVKFVSNQERVISILLRKGEQWNFCERRAFIYALQDRGLWPTLYGELTNTGNLNEIPELKYMMLRASTFACGLTDGAYVLDESTDEGMYELILREAYKFEFDKMYELINAWNASESWAAKKALLVNFFREDKDCLIPVKIFIENRENPASERFVASLIYNVTSQIIPQPYKYTEYWKEGVEAPSDIMSYIASHIDKEKVQPKIFGVHSTQILGGQDITSFPESIRLLQYLVNTGLTTKFGIYNLVNIEHWMKAFRHLVHFIPYPTIYYTLQYADEKTVRWAGQMIAYSDDEFFVEIRPSLLISLLKSLRMEHVPRYLKMGLYYLTQELYMSVPEDMWYDEFKQSVLYYFADEIDAKNVSTSDAIYKNLFYAIQCIKKVERRQEIFVILTKKMPQNVHLISLLFCGALWVDKDFAAMDEVSKCLWKIINNTLISQSYSVLCEFNRVDALSAEQKEAIDNKIATEDLSFSKSDYPALINLSHLAISSKSISKIKQIVLTGDIWNCGITDSCYTDPSPYHIEIFDDKVIWTEDEWQQIQINMKQNLDLIEKHKEIGESSNFYNCMYIDLLSDMKMFMIRLQQKNGINVDDMIQRVNTDIEELSGFENLLDALSSDDYNRVNVALNLLNVLLRTDDFDKHKSEINLVISKVALKQSADIDNCINFIVFLMQHYPVEMKKNYGDLLLCLLKNYADYDFEKMNFRVPVINHRLSLIAHRMKPEYEETSQVRYWTSKEVINRFGGLDEIK